jgi:hypothetical protein
MDELVTFYSESGFPPHVTIRIGPLPGHSGETTGLGFGPERRAPVGRGDIHHDDGKGTPDYNEKVSFKLSVQDVTAAVQNTRTAFSDDAYVLVVNDCVSFARYFAESCGLRVGLKGFTWWPKSFVKLLRELNQDRVFQDD